eukprot:Hpha_TRINITY_DN15029_c5_g12::TRINITY_DN15029_c5_g12_i1::g.125587::m.125587/K14824/ERB1, BOP1; ribosome biogenesis protein ERB1
MMQQMLRVLCHASPPPQDTLCRRRAAGVPRRAAARPLAAPTRPPSVVAPPPCVLIPVPHSNEHPRVPPRALPLPQPPAPPAPHRVLPLHVPHNVPAPRPSPPPLHRPPKGRQPPQRRKLERRRPLLHPKGWTPPKGRVPPRHRSKDTPQHSHPHTGKHSHRAQEGPLVRGRPPPEDEEEEGEGKTVARKAYERVGDDDSYSSDDEYGPLVRTGDVPLIWYKDEDHAGYDVEGRKIAKETRDALQQLIAKVDSPEEMMTIYEKLTGKAHKLSKEDIQVILNLQANKYPDANFDPYPDMMDTVRFKPGQNPFEKGMPAKKRFQPISKHEMRQIAKLVRRLRRYEETPPPKPPDKDPTFDIWGADQPEDDASVVRRRRWHIGPPKAPLPSTAESYNPPLEYLPSKEEVEQIEKEEPIDRPEFVPQKFDALRKVPFYKNTLRERYQRCLDLFMFTRKKKSKVNIKPESLLPDLPRPDELKPFPQKLGFVYTGHTGPTRWVAPNPSGEYIATACDDHFGRVFEVTTGRLVAKWNLRAPVSWCGWSPNPTQNIVAFAANKILSFAVPRACAIDSVNETSVEFLRSGLGKAAKAEHAIKLVSQMDVGSDDDEAPPEDLEKGIDEDDPEGAPPCRWEDYAADSVECKRGLILKVVHHFRIRNVAWHHKGDYVASLCPHDQKSRQLVMMMISQRSLFVPFKKFKESVQCVTFHPTQPHLLICTRKSVRVYNLLQSQLVKKLRGTVENISSIDVHPQGDNVLASSHDKKVMWYDLDMSDKPYKKLTSHRSAVNVARYHPTTSVYPLFASAGDDGQIHVFHGRVYDDLTKNAFIVPLKILKAHKTTEAVGVTNIAFHPNLPWLFSCGGDGLVKLWTE